MPFGPYPDGLYIMKQKSPNKGVDHYGILDVGNRIRHPQIHSIHPVVLHQTPPEVRLDWYHNTGSWEMVGRVTDEPGALARIAEAMKNPKYDLFGNNCEHFARFIATGKRESVQLQTVAAVAGFAALIFLIVQEERGA